MNPIDDAPASAPNPAADEAVSPVVPSAEDLDKVAAEQQAAAATEVQADPAADPNPPDTDKLDSLGQPKGDELDPPKVGPRGEDLPKDAQTADELKKAQEKKDAAQHESAAKASVTDFKDSAGNPSDLAPVGPRGSDLPKDLKGRNEAKEPEAVPAVSVKTEEHDEQPAVPPVGPRGSGLQPDNIDPAERVKLGL